MNSLINLLQDHEIFHSEFQIKHMIIARAGGTIYGAYKQSLRELWQRVRGLNSMVRVVDSDHSSCADRISENTGHDSLGLVCCGSLETLPMFRDTLREAVVFYRLAKTFRTQLGDLDHKKRSQLECELWSHRVRCAIAVDYISSGRISSSTIELLQSLPLEMRRPLLDEILNPSNHESIVNWFLTYSLEIPPLVHENTEAETCAFLQCFEQMNRLMCRPSTDFCVMRLLSNDLSFVGIEKNPDKAASYSEVYA